MKCPWGRYSFLNGKGKPHENKVFYFTLTWNVDETAGGQQPSYDPEHHEDGGTGTFQPTIFAVLNDLISDFSFVRKKIHSHSATVSMSLLAAKYKS